MRHVTTLLRSEKPADGSGTPAASAVLDGKKSAADIQPPAPAPSPVKDAKWLETEIAVTEDLLKRLRDQKKATTIPATPSAKPKIVLSTLPLFHSDTA